jgi:hypothetical protein
MNPNILYAVARGYLCDPSFMAPQPHGAFGTQLNFIRACHYQTKDKIRLLFQKLEGKFVRAPPCCNARQNPDKD